MEELFDAVVTNSKFLYSSFYGYTNQNVIDFFEDAGVPVKIERENRVFPISDHSSDVIRALEREMKKVGVKVCLNTEVKSVEAEKGKFNKGSIKRYYYTNRRCMYCCDRWIVLPFHRIYR